MLPGSAVHAKYASLIDAGGAHAWRFGSVQAPPAWFKPSADATPAIRRRHRAIFDVQLDGGWPAKPRIAVFSGPQSTVANTAPLLTSNEVRQPRR